MLLRELQGGFTRTDYGNVECSSRSLDTVIGKRVDHDRIAAGYRGSLHGIDVTDIDQQPLVGGKRKQRETRLDQLHAHAGVADGQIDQLWG